MEFVYDQLKSPVTRGALEYWHKKRGTRRMPARNDLDPLEISTLLPNMILLDVLQDPLDFRYRLVGTVIDDHTNQPLTGLLMSELPHQAAPSKIWSACEHVVASKAPFRSQVPYIGPKRDFIVPDDIIMPLSEDDETVNMLLVVVDYMRMEGLEESPA